MPRTRQQPPRAASDQAYGVRGDQVTAQRQMPLPQTAARPLNPAQAGAPVTAAAPAPTGPGGVNMEALMLAQGMQGGTPLTAPTTRPGEPVTAGLPIGPGPGPEALAGMFQAKRDRVAETLQRLADDLGDGFLAQLAMKANEMAGR